LQEELKINPSDAGKEYVSRELAGQMQDFSAAAEHFRGPKSSSRILATHI